MRKRKKLFWDLDFEVGDRFRGFVKNYHRSYWGGREVEVVEHKKQEHNWSKHLPLIHKDLIDAFDELEPSRGDLIEIERLPNDGARYCYQVKVLSRNPLADRSYYRNNKQNIRSKA